MLVAIGADINQSKDDFTDSPIYLAVDTRSKEMVQCLLEVGVDSMKQLQAALKLARKHNLDDIIGLLLSAIALDKDRRVLNLSGLELLEIKPAWIRPSLGLSQFEDLRTRKRYGHQRTSSWDNVLDRIKSKTLPMQVGEKEVNSSDDIDDVMEDVPPPSARPRKQSMPEKGVTDQMKFLQQRRASLGFLQQQELLGDGSLSIREFAAAAIDSIRPQFMRQRQTRPHARPRSPQPKLVLTRPEPEVQQAPPTETHPKGTERHFSVPVEEETVTSSGGFDEPDRGTFKERSVTICDPVHDFDSSDDDETQAHSPRRRHQSLALGTVTGAQHTNFSALDQIKRRRQGIIQCDSPKGGSITRQISQLLSPLISREDKTSPVSPSMVRRAAKKTRTKDSKARRRVEFSSSSDDGSAEVKPNNKLHVSTSPYSITSKRKSVDETDSPGEQKVHRRLPRNTSSSSTLAMEVEQPLVALDISSNSLSSLSSLVQEGPEIAMKLNALRMLDAKQNQLKQVPRALFQVSVYILC